MRAGSIKFPEGKWEGGQGTVLGYSWDSGSREGGKFWCELG